MKYTESSPLTSNYKVTTSGPLDVRAVVAKKADLYNLTGEDSWGLEYDETFGGYLNTILYKGMVVAVVDDSTSSNNGLYCFVYNNPNEDDVYSDTRLPDNSWRKIDTPVDDVTIKFNDNSKIYVHKVDGGTFTNGEE